MDNLPLVTVTVITYNSSKYVLETLNSVYNQTYPNIELIISDDNSKDDTVPKVQEWLSVFKNKFVKTTLLFVTENTGITANCTRAFEKAEGKWLKSIAGDDFLFPDAIESYVKFVTERESEDISFVVSSVRIFNEHPDNLIYNWPNFKINSDINTQIKKQITGSYVKSPGVFMKLETFHKLGGLNPRYPMLEDDPLWVKAMMNGYKFYHLDKVLVAYRIHSGAVSNGTEIPKKHFFDSLYKFKHEVTFPLMKKKGLYLKYLIQKREFKILNRAVQTQKISGFDKLQIRVLNKFVRMS